MPLDEQGRKDAQRAQETLERLGGRLGGITLGENGPGNSNAVAKEIADSLERIEAGDCEEITDCIDCGAPSGELHRECCPTFNRRMGLPHGDTTIDRRVLANAGPETPEAVRSALISMSKDLRNLQQTGLISATLPEINDKLQERAQYVALVLRLAFRYAAERKLI